VSVEQVLEWTRHGVRRGVQSPVKLACVELPSGRAWREEDVADFLERLRESRMAARGELAAAQPLKLVGAGAKAAERAMRVAPGARQGGFKPSFKRCVLEAIGTHVPVESEQERQVRVGRRRAAR